MKTFMFAVLCLSTTSSFSSPAQADPGDYMAMHCGMTEDQEQGEDDPIYGEVEDEVDLCSDMTPVQKKIFKLLASDKITVQEADELEEKLSDVSEVRALETLTDIEGETK